MSHNKITALLIALTSLGHPLLAAARLLEDSTTTLETRNFYMNRDFRQDGAKQSKAEDWAQGFMLNYKSGYTEGDIGVGADLFALLGVKLDSGRGTHGTGALPVSADSGRSPDEFSALMPTVKVRYARTEAKVGAIWPTLPVLYRNDTRLFPQNFYGGYIESRPLENLTLTGARIDSTRLRDSTDRTDLTVYGVDPGASSDRMYVGGVDYAVNNQLRLLFYRSEVENIYTQNFYSLISTAQLQSLKFKLDLRYFDSQETGERRGGDVENQNINGLFTVSRGVQSITLGYQKLLGHSAFPIINGSDPYTANLMTSQPFIRPGEESFQLRHDIDLAGLGIPGLTIMNRYAKGTSIQRVGADDRKWERDLDIKYVIQSGLFSGVYGLWRNASYRSRFSNDIDENRIFIGYTFHL